MRHSRSDVADVSLRESNGQRRYRADIDLLRSESCESVQSNDCPEVDAPAESGGASHLCLNTRLLSGLADNSRANYEAQWKGFVRWTQGRETSALPARPDLVETYLGERFETYGHRPATLRAVASAIAFVHKSLGLEDPCDTPGVKALLRSVTREAGKMQKQAAALTEDALALIMASACNPRPGRGGGLESAATARKRCEVDIAIMCLMRDAMLRVSEAAALTWGDISTKEDGTGRLLIRRSKTDPDGEGVVAYISVPTMSFLESIRVDANEGDSVFGLRPNQIARRIKQAAQSAGLGDDFSGHSPRVGMACDLARAGIELPSLMTAGRWRSPKMPALYTRNETVVRGAIAQFYGLRSGKG